MSRFHIIHLLVLFSCSGLSLIAQTDETIYREFQFDFSTPGARANGMGRAFVGLADEATAGYANPAGISVLDAPELYIEWRSNRTDYFSIRENDLFTFVDLSQTPVPVTTFDARRVGFLSYSFSARGTNFSLYYVNNLDYRRDPVQDAVDVIYDDGAEFTFRTAHHVRKIRLDTLGFSVSRRFGNLSAGASVGASSLDVDFSYDTNLVSGDLDIFETDPVTSIADRTQTEPTFVLGLLYRVNPAFNIGFSAKLHPSFVYTQNLSSRDFPEGVEAPITFRVPDSYQLGLAYQPNDRWTLVCDVDWVRYRQLIEDMTIITRLPITKEDFAIGEQADTRLGAEYFIPTRRLNYALRFGTFYDHDHKTRFVGEPLPPFPEGEDPAELPAFYDILQYVYNTDEEEDDLGFTLGLGLSLAGKLQVDVAYVESDRFRRLVASCLFRF